ncbi:uncharacterized protein LOC143921108 [Arctopsyche grandis]|uniref:uncharacterized protein LOC143921108 n=1 Tax=Arctopsyche grandis TaxID=121162 RepID=UPI00406DA32A
MRVIFLMVTTLAMVLGAQLPLKSPVETKLEITPRLRAYYLLNVPKTFVSGDKVEIEGKLALKSTLFSINFVSNLKNGLQNDIPYQQRIYVTNNTIVLSSKADSIWVERAIYKTSPVQPGDRFKVIFEIFEEGIYSHFNNGDERTFLAHQSSDKEIKYISIWDEDNYSGIESIDSVKFNFVD